MAQELATWNPSTIFDVRDKSVRFRDGRAVMVKLYTEGWAIAEYDGLDVWAACRLLNDCGARAEAAEL